MSGLMPPGILSYIGQVAVPYINRTFAPTTSFNDFSVPTIWTDTSSGVAYILVSKALGVADWVAIGSMSGGVDTITTPDSVVVTPSAGNINFLNGVAMNITGSGSSITFNSTGGGFSWSVVSGTSQALAAGHGYLANNAAGVSFSLPATAAVGDTFSISTITTGAFTVTQGAGQQIQIGNHTTTLGGGGSLVSTAIGDNVTIVCSAANTNFLVTSSMGNITYV